MPKLSQLLKFEVRVGDQAPKHDKMRLFSYIVSHDTGFAPNPFWGYCTLACCKPVIRRVAQKGDWVVGISPKSRGNRLVHAMRITERPISFGDYFCDPRFECKKPDYRKKSTIYRRGDNIYRPFGQGEYKQLRSRHSLATGAEDSVKKHHDLSGRFVLISERFFYWGRESILLPPRLRNLVATRGHRSRFDESLKARFTTWISRYNPGLHGQPRYWPDDESLPGLSIRC